MIIRKSAQEIETMARAGKVVAETLALIDEQLQPGITTAELDHVADEFIRSHGGVPTFKGYKGYPAATCLSPNSMVVHGIPGPLKLQDGDILSVDVGVTLDGFVADSAWTYAVGIDLARGAAAARHVPGGPRGGDQGGRTSATRSATSRRPSRR